MAEGQPVRYLDGSMSSRGSFPGRARGGRQRGASEGRGRGFDHRGRGRGHFEGQGRGIEHRGIGRGHFEGRGGRGSYQPRHSDDRTLPMSVEQMRGLLDMSATDALIRIATPSSGFEKAIQIGSSSAEHTEHVLMVLEKVGQAQGATGTMSKILHKLIKSNFVLAELVPYLNRILIDRSINIKSTFCITICHIMKKMLEHIPAFSVDSVTMILGQLTGLLKAIRQTDMKDELQMQLAIVESLQTEVVQLIQGGSLHKEQTDSKYEDDMEPSNNFRQISIIPTSNDMREDVEIFLRKNRITGSYKDADQYLDIQFRLLREDYIMPLRQGIREIMRSGDKKIDEKYIQDVRIYNNVRNHGAYYSEKGVVYRFQFDVSNLRMVKWEISHRLIFGSLVCLSANNFQTIIIGIVSERDPKLLRKGLVDILINNIQNLDASPFVRYKMVECSAYFEAYKHNLEGLQELNNETLPFQQYLLNKDVDAAHPPRYLRGNDTVYDFEPLIKTNNKLKQLALKQLRVLDLRHWPTAGELGLDESQYRAVQMAITREFSIIQGPPGTGKTFIGLKIVQLLLHNFDKWGHARVGRQLERVTNPILIVCYTNHALDQFLEGILKFTHGGIVRVGSRSSSEDPELQRCLLSKLKRDDQIRDLIPSEVKDAKSATWEQMKQQEEHLSQIGSILTLVSSQVLDEQCLLNMMIPQHRQAFEHMKDKKRSHMVHWLMGAYQEPIQKMAPNQENWDDGMPTEHEEVDEGQEYEENEDFFDEEAEKVERERKACSDDEGAEERLGHKSKKMLNSTVQTEIKIDFSQIKGRGDWQIVVSAKKLKKVIKAELGRKDCMTENEEVLIENIWQLSFQQRWHLYRLWTKRLCTDCVIRMQNGMVEFNQLARQLQEMKDEQDWHILRRARVIAMTTTGAAKYRHILRRIEPRIVIVEEAAEVMEAHIVTSLSENCQHVILIGDHQQLRPNPTVYKLAKNYHLDISLFERMLANNMHCESLTVQHRMRPEIAKLIVPHIYQKLQNHDSVLHYENVPGIGGNVYFISHSELETQAPDSKSHSNDHEADYLTALCRYILQQGFTPEQVTILTTYRGQMYELKKRTRRNPDTELVRVTPVDNYQGEENDIILLSLVRSNEEGRVGFIKIANRICVALSRAKKGFYVIGNMELIRETSAIWRNIMKELESDGKLVKGIPLVCQLHPEMRIEAVSAADFAKAPEGGCTKPCEARLKCGHVCRLKCHPTDQDHKKYQCQKPCIRSICVFGHDCPKRCCDECGECMAPMEKIIPTCGHKQMVPCSVEPDKFVCQEACERELGCSHLCSRKCGDKCITQEQCAVVVPGRYWPCGHKHEIECHKNAQNYPCPTQVDRELPCGHTATMPCSTDVSSYDCKEDVQLKFCERQCENKFACYMTQQYLETGCQVWLDKRCKKNKKHVYKVRCSEYDTGMCQLICSVELKCGHLCQGNCGNCTKQGDHKQCTAPCERLLPCLHKCQGTCGEACSPCTNKCTKGCPHGVCRKPCGEPCFSCQARCSWSCQHIQCPNPCGEPCDREPCNRPCPKRMTCGHPCPGFCGELCMPACPICQVGFYQQMQTALGVQLSRNQKYVVLQPCNHAIPSTTMYKVVQEGRAGQRAHEFTALRCPMCRTHVRYCPRYQRDITRQQKELDHIKKACNDSNTVVSKLRIFPDAQDLVIQLTQVTDAGNAKYARKCLGCLSILGEITSLVKRVKQAKDGPGKSMLTSLEKDLESYMAKVHALILDETDKEGLQKLIAQLNIFFVECHARNLITYVKNPRKQHILDFIIRDVAVVRKSESMSQLVTRARNHCDKLQMEIPAGLRKGINNYGETIKQFYKGAIFLETNKKWILCNYGHAYAVTLHTKLEDARCTTCSSLDDPDLDDEAEYDAAHVVRYPPHPHIPFRPRFTPRAGVNGNFGEGQERLRAARPRVDEDFLRLEEEYGYGIYDD